MADRTVDILLVGGGIASASVARTIRDEGFAGSMLLVGRAGSPLPPAPDHGATVAWTILGSEAPHTEIPYFFSNLADWLSLEYVGPAADWDAEIANGDFAAGV